MNLVVAMSLLGALPPVLALLLSAVAIEQLNTSQPDFLENYAESRSVLEYSMLLVGTVIGLGTLATGGLQNALSAWAGSMDLSPAPFPPMISILYGCYFSLMLATLYVPPRVKLIALANQFVDEKAPLTDFESDEWVAKYDMRTKMLESLGAEVNVVGSLRNAILIGTPLIGGVISYMFGQ